MQRTIFQVRLFHSRVHLSGQPFATPSWCTEAAPLVLQAPEAKQLTRFSTPTVCQTRQRPAHAAL